VGWKKERGQARDTGGRAGAERGVMGLSVVLTVGTGKKKKTGVGGGPICLRQADGRGPGVFRGGWRHFSKKTTQDWDRNRQLEGLEW